MYKKSRKINFSRDFFMPLYFCFSLWTFSFSFSALSAKRPPLKSISKTLTESSSVKSLTQKNR